jgi:hypothetical protein
MLAGESYPPRKPARRDAAGGNTAGVGSFLPLQIRGQIGTGISLVETFRHRQSWKRAKRNSARGGGLAGLSY